MRVFWNAERGDYIPNWSQSPIKAKSKANYSCFVQRAINVSPTQYTDNSAAAFKYFAPFPPTALPPCCSANCPPEIYSSRQNGFALAAIPAMHCAAPLVLVALNSNGRLAVHCAPLCTGGGGTAAVCSGGKFTQDWDLWAALGQLAQQGGGPIALFLHPNPAPPLHHALLHLHARVACFTCITWTVRLPWHPFLFCT